MPEVEDSTTAEPGEELEGTGGEVLADLIKQLGIELGKQDQINKNLKNEINKLRRSIKKEKKSINDIEREVGVLNSKLLGQETKVVETLGIFVALFTFISVNIQIFSKVSDLLSASLFSVILAALTGVIILTVLLATHSYEEEDIKWWVKFILLLVVFVGMLSFGLLRLSLNPGLHYNTEEKTQTGAETQKESFEDQGVPQTEEQVQQ